jgi:hypothetical protein
LKEHCRRLPEAVGGDQWGVPGIKIPRTREGSIDDLDDATGSLLHQDRTTVDDGVTAATCAVLLRHVVVADPIRRQHGADTNVAIIGVGRPALSYAGL